MALDTSVTPHFTPQMEEKWQAYWEQENVYKTPLLPKQPTCYVLDMFPYPSGAGLHVGHPLGYIASDIYARYKRMQGYAVLHPMGFDAFGLPAEQYAIETGQHPAKTTAINIARYKEQLRRLGLSYDWDREICTSDPDFYKWTQWMFGLFYDSWYDKKRQQAAPIDRLRKLLADGGTSAVQAACSPDAPTFSAADWRGADKKQQDRWLLSYRLAYLDEIYVNWCPVLGTVLSNDEVKEGFSERGGHPVVKSRRQQWMLRITAYADRLLADMQHLMWPTAILDMQRHWIGRSEGIEIDFQVEGADVAPLRIYTTRADTIYGVTFMCISVECATRLPLSAAAKDALARFVQTRPTYDKSQTQARDAEACAGFFTGLYALHPLTEERLPIWVTNYVLSGYGTGAVMAVPAHDTRDYAFAKAHNLPIRKVIVPLTPCEEEVYAGKDGTLQDSGPLSGCTAQVARKKVLSLLQQKTQAKPCTNYRLRDAIFARQRYWGEPMPVYTNKDQLPQLLETKALPLLLPEIADYLPTAAGKPPLARAKGWHTPEGYPYGYDTMPGWAGSSWYFFRYMDPHNKHAFCSKEALDTWKQVDLYVGGSEHAVGHLLYARFWTKFLYDRGLIATNEFAKKLVNQGMMYGRSYFVFRKKREDVYVSHGLCKQHAVSALYVENHLVDAHNVLDIAAFCKSRSSRKNARFILEDGKYHCGTEMEKMSKSKHNVINPDPLLKKYGADTLRLYEMFMGPVEQSKPWDTKGMEGVHRFLKKMWRLFHSQETRFFVDEQPPQLEELRLLHKTIQKAGKDTEAFAFNTAISAMMIAVNELQRLKCYKRTILEPLLLVLCPYAPHMAEELWHRCGHNSSVTQQPFPVADARYLQEDTIVYPISINGKLRAKIELPTSFSKEDIEKSVRTHEVVQRWLAQKTPKKIIIVPGKIVNVVL